MLIAKHRKRIPSIIHQRHVSGQPLSEWSALKYGSEPTRTDAMGTKKHKPEEVVAKLRQVDVLVSQG